MLRIILLCRQSVKELPYLLKHVPDGYKTQQMCNKAILEIYKSLKSAPDCCKNG